ncbi:hypothetical protein K7W03_14435 [Sphingobium sp. PNB]|uniref:hypothetical protein n=1 Tax=Sphingobium sp. PNB TaxID=863934 RepID=UPI001CA3E12D|nr:hypothetical protein [Sphingobium sp. PNB]MCB4860789.1 hypothetical protein [Sphingobium sp. PNB]
MITRIPLPEYKPDQSQNSGVLLKAQNVFPAMDGYRSVGAIETLSDALAAPFQGGASAIASNGNAYLLAGTESELFRLNADFSWTSLLDSLTAPKRWRFAQFKEYTVAVNGGDTLQVDLGTSTASVIADAPTGTSVAVVGDFVVIGQADGNINRVQWSAFDDHTAWTPAVNQSGFQPMNTGGSVMGICGGEYGIILQRERLVRMTRTGDSDAPFQFDEVSSNFGCAAGATIAQAGRSIFFRSDRGFMALDDGQALRPIGSEKVDRTFDRLVSRDQLENIYTAVDPQNKLVMWLVPGAPGTMWTYNFELDRWSTIVLTAKGLFPGFTTSVGLDDLEGLGYTDLDSMPFSLDDPRWTGGNPKLYLLDATNAIGTLAGATLEAQIEMGYNELANGRRARLRNVRPVWDGTSGMTVTANAKQRLGDGNNISTASTLRASGRIPIRASGRYISTSLHIAAGVDWDYIQALDYEFEQGGAR